MGRVLYRCGQQSARHAAVLDETPLVPEEQTKIAIRRHFELAKPGGLVLITFPVPTFSYRLIRRAAEMLGIWRFPDERPIRLEDAVCLCAEHGEIIDARLNRAILLTQGIVLARKPR